MIGRTHVGRERVVWGPGVNVHHVLGFAADKVFDTCLRRLYLHATPAVAATCRRLEFRPQSHQLITFYCSLPPNAVKVR